ncbi:hypothetical protein [Mycobacterium sp. 050134]|uniref:hypothetical protein n=1 Tax=Mycobacterium sp. 050134 TaxID=3096111 RepID=UPI002ED9A00E
MTPFMLRVGEALEHPAEIDLPLIRSSRPMPAAIGTDGHVECRSLAEQLVCEANVVLASSGRERLSLTDDALVSTLSFCISYADRQARIVTDISRAVATGHLYGFGAHHPGDVELTGPDQIEQLILLLIGGRTGGPAESAVPEPGTLAP